MICFNEAFLSDSWNCSDLANWSKHFPIFWNQSPVEEKPNSRADLRDLNKELGHFSKYM